MEFEASTRRSRPAAARFGFAAAVATTVATVTSFAFALRAIPISGAFCPGGCVEYPYLNTADQFPRDFVWMIPAMLLVVCYLVLVAAIHGTTNGERRLLSHTGWSFALISTTVLLINYWVQFSVVPISLMRDQTVGLPLIIQYNPHGLFLVLEELGYLMMSLSFLFIGLSFPSSDRLRRAIRWVFLSGFGLAVVALVVISAVYGLERLDRFEVAVISIDWILLLVNGVLLALHFRTILRDAHRSRET